MARVQPLMEALSAAAKFPSGEAVSPGRVVIAGNSNAKPYRGFTRINADQGVAVPGSASIVNDCRPWLPSAGSGLGRAAKRARYIAAVNVDPDRRDSR